MTFSLAHHEKKVVVLGVKKIAPVTAESVALYGENGTNHIIEFDNTVTLNLEGDFDLELPEEFEIIDLRRKRNVRT